MGRLLRWYYAVKYYAFRRERRPRDDRRGLVVLQIDALAYADLRRALELGYCPTIARLLREEGYTLRRWFCGLPSATPYCQAGIFHGENAGIPAFRFYDKKARYVITCNAPHGVQYIRDRLTSPGALAGGSSYVNLLDGDARTVAFTVATRERTSVYRRLGGTRMALLILLHPLRMARIALQSAWEWLREEWERVAGELAGRVTHAEGIFPFVRILSNVVVRELQTLAILLDIYLGVPVIYSTYMQYDELAHHFGPSSRQALSDLRRTDARIRELRRMIRWTDSRGYDLVILSDHGMTPAVSYRVRFRESLGATISRMLEDAPRARDEETPRLLASFAEASEYADIGPRIAETVAMASRGRHRRFRRAVRRLRDWVRSRYGLREIIFPEKYRVDARQDVVVTYSSCLALVYFADAPEQLGLGDIAAVGRRAHLYASLLAHPGIGLVATRMGRGVHLESREGRALIAGGRLEVLAGANPLTPYGTEEYVVRAVHDLVAQPNAGDLVLFGAFDGYEIVSFDDQVGAHGSAGGDQMYPFIITPPRLDIAGERLEDARDIHRAVMMRYAATRTEEWNVERPEVSGDE
ncbi:MAG TPA: alkaline phosphatase family protein [Gemmatimonadaceae bacterium]|nr:alkaline phosphatase family protein [Gemmatimonadaceae bacterium]